MIGMSRDHDITFINSLSSIANSLAVENLEYALHLSLKET